MLVVGHHVPDSAVQEYRFGDEDVTIIPAAMFCSSQFIHLPYVEGAVTVIVRHEDFIGASRLLLEFVNTNLALLSNINGRVLFVIVDARGETVSNNIVDIINPDTQCFPSLLGKSLEVAA